MSSICFISLACKLSFTPVSVSSNFFQTVFRLPNFSLPTAVDVLTTGSFNRLPLCIKVSVHVPN